MAGQDAASQKANQATSKETSQAANHGDAAAKLGSQVTVADAVFTRLREIVAAEGGAERFLRVSVLGGGCSGFQYKFELEGAPAEDDLVFEQDDVGVLVDCVSAPFLENAVIDYKQELIGARFAVENPNAASTCGCGVSFSI